ncbi:Oxidase ustYa [Paramyrothecium foliicola]|nr:Oxidase ustYa [Paramyrothecium foliicola]
METDSLDKPRRGSTSQPRRKSNARRSLHHPPFFLVMNFLRESAGYRAVPCDKERQDSTTARPSVRLLRGSLLGLAGLSVFVLGVLVGAGTGSRSRSGPACAVETLQQPSSPAVSAPPIDLAFTVVEKPFKYNRTFGEDPFHNQATVDAWEDIVPLGQGSVQWPDKSHKVYTLSVVHQLHCLLCIFLPFLFFLLVFCRRDADDAVQWSIHQSYYTDSRDDENGQDEHNHNQRHRRGEGGFAHMRHCFDYLRQTLMCAGDVTLEPVDPELGGVTGWDNLRVCRDYDQIKQWAEMHRVSDLRGFLETPDGHGHHHG